MAGWVWRSRSLDKLAVQLMYYHTAGKLLIGSTLTGLFLTSEEDDWMTSAVLSVSVQVILTREIVCVWVSVVCAYNRSGRMFVEAMVNIELFVQFAETPRNAPYVILT